ncbi:MAG TPA: 1-deoxy-D-xylulose-5-phosphate synthase [Deltaproteobacteria bacterium]|nr:1-deoxy-D-xylulose-5-phosphate synthase [Deltaproteobacteria bacterium]HCY10213.1 1-deoxy-D-xylulose-5-phosphate synthase [Deltaproteobacteria bacterium]
MKKLLDRIEAPKDMKALAPEELVELAAELRELIIETVSDKGGHLASSLGAVEIAIALHYALDTPEDKIIWDVGHQAYAHKILTGRKREFTTLRQYGGISGFPKPSESPFDAFIAGHSSTSISAALGIASARDLGGADYKVVAVIGDGSLTAGLAFEGLNQAGHLKKNLIVILNDNEMSISKNVGALSQFLSRKLTGRFATNLKKDVERFIKSIPRIGGRLFEIARRADDSIITLLTPGMLFEGLGFHYIGPIDGHDINALVASLNDVSTIQGPVLLHVLTRKGKGYLPAEADPAAFHGVGPFVRETGKSKKASKPSYTNVFSSALLEIAEKDRRVVAITAAMPEGTGLSTFAERHPERFFDVGIAEQHALTFAGGLAKEGFVPVTAIYSTFLQRAYDEVVHDVCIQKLPVVIAIDRAGIVGQDGPTHHGIFDISYLRHIPNMTVSAPKDEDELRHLLYSSVQYGTPASIRYPRGACLGVDTSGPMRLIPAGEAEVLRTGKDATIIALGTMVGPAMEAALSLEKAGIHAGVINARFVKPLDAGCILKAAASTGCLVTVEEGALQGGFGAAVLELLEERMVTIPVKRLGVPDEFIEHGTQEELRERLGLTAGGIEAAVRIFAAGKKSVKMAF